MNFEGKKNQTTVASVYTSKSSIIMLSFCVCVFRSFTKYPKTFPLSSYRRPMSFAFPASSAYLQLVRIE